VGSAGTDTLTEGAPDADDDDVLHPARTVLPASINAITGTSRRLILADLLV
jgi:hypothetical protein